MEESGGAGSQERAMDQPPTQELESNAESLRDNCRTLEDLNHIANTWFALLLRLDIKRVF